MSRTVAVTAPAKINLSLGVGSPRDDGFHPLATVYQAVGLLDTVTVADADEVTVTVSGDARIATSDVPLGEGNIAVRAARALAAQAGTTRGARIHIDKGIPVAGGMAGGSADAAATLVACDQLWGLGWSKPQLAELAAELGSDVPFALAGGTAIGTGRGEVVTPLMTRGEYWWVVVEADRGLSTPAVYAEFDALHTGTAVGDPEIPDVLLTALRRHDLATVGATLTNDLQPPALRLRPELDDVLVTGLTETALGAVLSGSGPTCLFLCDGQAHAVQLSTVLRGHGLGPVSAVAGPVPGARVVAVEA